jgi:F420-0:gamma-glutamyl ligase
MTEPAPAATPERLVLRSLEWPEIEVGDDLAELVCSVPNLADGDVVVVTSKVISKAEGRYLKGDRTAAVDREAQRVVARRGATVIAETRHGFVLAAAGVDSSNVAEGVLLALPVEPDATARSLRSDVHARIGIKRDCISGRPRQGQAHRTAGRDPQWSVRLRPATRQARPGCVRPGTRPGW